MRALHRPRTRNKKKITLRIGCCRLRRRFGERKGRRDDNEKLNGVPTIKRRQIDNKNDSDINKRPEIYRSILFDFVYKSDGHGAFEDEDITATLSLPSPLIIFFLLVTYFEFFFCCCPWQIASPDCEAITRS